MVTIATVKATAIPMADLHQSVALNRLLQLCSANLPVGGFSFSQGLEYAVEVGWISDKQSTHHWIDCVLHEAVAPTDLAVLGRMYGCLQHQDWHGFADWDRFLLACRESQELLLADEAMGKALILLLNNLDSVDKSGFEMIFQSPPGSFTGAFVLASCLFGLDLNTAQSGFCWTFLDNQVAAATKLVPLGQTQAQNLLFDLSSEVTSAIKNAEQLGDEELGASLPGLAMASAWHESQYTRLFRS